MAATPSPPSSTGPNLPAAVLEMLDAAGGSIAVRQATALGAALWRADALKHAPSASAAAAGSPRHADLWAGAVFAIAESGWIRRERGSFVVTDAGRDAIRAQAAHAGSAARALIPQLTALTADELRKRALLA